MSASSTSRCGAGRHAFEAFRRGAQVVPLDRFASELTDVPGTLTAMADAGEAADGAAGQPVAAGAAVPRRRFRSGDRVRGARAHFRRRRRTGRAGAGRSPGRLPGGHRAGLATRDALLAPLGAVPAAGREGPCADLHGGGAAGEDAGAGLEPGGAPRLHAALPLLVAQVRSGPQQRRPPARPGLSPPAGVGHRPTAPHDQGRRAPAPAGDRQEHRRVRHAHRWPTASPARSTVPLPEVEGS